LGVTFSSDAKWNIHIDNIVMYLQTCSSKVKIYSRVSSAKSRLRDIRFAAISLIYMINNRGSSTDLWGTPAETLQSQEDEFIHIENILLNIYKHLKVHRKLKYKLSR
jgi:hypothetical protein